MAETINAYEMGPGRFVGYWHSRETEIKILVEGENYHISTEDKAISITGVNKDFDKFEVEHEVDVKFVTR